jgi:hypothetical protein
VYHDGPGEAWSGFERADSPSQGPGRGASAPSGRGLRSPSRPPPGLERRTTKRPASDNVIRNLTTNIIVAGRHKLKAPSIRRSNSVPPQRTAGCYVAQYRCSVAQRYAWVASRNPRLSAAAGRCSICGSKVRMRRRQLDTDFTSSHNRGIIIPQRRGIYAANYPDTRA